jgi:hypothetical protein
MASFLDLAGDVHDSLLKLVAPATPGSIQASSLKPHRNPALFVVMLCGLVSFIVFIVPVLAPLAGWTFSDDLKSLLQIIGGAGLGSSFYGLHTASDYIKSSTFDPKYGNTYLIRLGLGILAGLILAFFLRDFLDGATANSPVKKLSVYALALIGGYSAEAVARILDRIADTLIALVSGSDKDKIDSARDKANADAEKKAAQKSSEAIKDLQALAIANPTVAANVTSVINKMIDTK